MNQEAFKKRNQKSKRHQHGGDDKYMEKVIKINRVTKVCKGGKRLGFRALVIVGDKSGSVSIGLGKSKEVPIAIKKGIESARKTLQKFNIYDGTLPHEIMGRFGAAKVILKPAPKGTGVIAGGSVRILLEAAGLTNVVAKSLGSDNAINTARAALNGLGALKNIEKESKIRGKALAVKIYSSNQESEIEEAPVAGAALPEKKLAPKAKAEKKAQSKKEGPKGEEKPKEEKKVKEAKAAPKVNAPEASDSIKEKENDEATA